MKKIAPQIKLAETKIGKQKIKNKNKDNKETISYSYRTAVPKEIVSALNLKTGDIIEWYYDFESNKVVLEINSPNDSEEATTNRKTQYNIDRLDNFIGNKNIAENNSTEPKEKDNNKKTPLNTITKQTNNTTQSNNKNKLDVTKFPDVSLNNDYIIKVTSPSRPKLRIVDPNKKETGIAVGNKSEEEVKEIIEKLKNIKNPDNEKIIGILNLYRKDQYKQ